MAMLAVSTYLQVSHATSFLYHVTDVVLVRPQKKVPGIYTLSIVTFMANAKACRNEPDV